MCGVVAIVAGEPVSPFLFDALTVLQHRGQDAAGIVTCDNNRFNLRKANGLVKDVFDLRHIQKLTGRMGIGHVRYPTAGGSCESEAQPFYVNSPFGIVMAHNGNLTNAQPLQQQLSSEELRHINTGSDSEIILNVFASELQKICDNAPTVEVIFKAIEKLHARCRGGYAIVAMIAGVGVVAFRDVYGIRPLIFGKRQGAHQTDVMVASESVALTSQGFNIIDDVKPGEAIFIEKNGNIHRQVCAAKTQLSPCLFELVYFARPDSIMDGISVYKVRMNMGKKLAKSISKVWDISDIDVVIPIPETSRSAALALAQSLHLKFREGFVKNRYVGRTFIMPGQKVRKKSVRQKLSVIEMEFKDKNVLLIDDSIVRGTTSQEIIQLAREAGAKKVYFASAAPVVRYPNIYGIDMPSAQELVGHNRRVEEIAQKIGADYLHYLELPHLIAAAKEGNPSINQFEGSVFDGHYLTGDESVYLQNVANARGDGVGNEMNKESSHSQIDLYNN